MSNCQGEMEKGELIFHARNVAVGSRVEWLAAEQKVKRLFGFETRRTIDLFENPNGRFPNAYYCPACKKVYCEFYVIEQVKI